jgi:hypothetical protein
MTSETDDQGDAANRKLHGRLALAHEDLQESRHYAMHLLDRRPDDPILVDALNAAMVVAYGRAFSAWSGKQYEAIGKLPDALRNGLDQPQSNLHDRLMTLRHTEFAHSDADAAQIKMARYVFPDDVIVTSDQRKLRVGLSRRELESAVGLISHLLVAIIGEINKIEARFKESGKIPTRRIGLPEV